MMAEIKQLQQKVASLEKEHQEYLLLEDTNHNLNTKVYNTATWSRQSVLFAWIISSPL
jgi:DNA repair protein RadC